jgi:hypothetical protein
MDWKSSNPQIDKPRLLKNHHAYIDDWQIDGCIDDIDWQIDGCIDDWLIDR